MKHLLLDDEGIELQDGLERRWHQPVKHGPPVLAPEGALEMLRGDSDPELLLSSA